MPRAGALDQLIAARSTVVVCGPGGVGKTTTAAALALGAALRSSARVLVLTVDPARRLADALGVSLGNEPTEVDLRHLVGGRRTRGSLHAAMLDPGASWDALVEQCARRREDAEEILANPLYANLTRRFALSHEYIAMERLYELSRSGEWDLLVIDTPPSQNALDFLDAPERMGEFFTSPFLRFFVSQRRSRLVDLASRPFYQVADRLLGTQLLADVSRFFVLFNTMHEDFVARARAVSELIRARETTFAVVSTLEPTPVGEARRLSQELKRRGLNVGLLVANRMLPEIYGDPALAELATRLRSDASGIAEGVVDTLEEGAAQEHIATVLHEVGESYENFRLVAARGMELLGELRFEHTVTARVGDVADASTHLEGIAAIANRLFEDGDASDGA